MKIFRSIVKVLPVLLLLLPSCRGVQAADHTPVQLASASALRLYQHSGCQLSPDQSGKLQQGLSQIQSVYAQALGHAPDPGHPLTVQLFCSEASYRAYGKSTGSDASSDTGYYSLERREMVVYSKYGLEKSLQTIYHEASHAILRAHPGPYPKWLNEGLAEYFEGGVPVPGALVVAPQQVKENRVQSLLQSGRLPALANYLSLTNQDWQLANRPEPLSSTIGWSLVYYLMESSTGRDMVKQLVSLHREQISPLVAINQVYPGGSAALEQDWHHWLQSPRKDHVW
ncbi:MAG: hypothetical protein CVV27_10365 [Candidatus Melainabacteria bacterium HGW-Melainabacteria-1]|nr:MAG: hypothetical protein CVV27_10365 [Candidatus Melainabacteria bacterium HGW-Melainabacteria-1]